MMYGTDKELVVCREAVFFAGHLIFVRLVFSVMYHTIVRSNVLFDKINDMV